MALKTIYIARHGYRANWLPPPHPPNPTGVDSDPPLAEHGVEQAKELANYIKTLSDKPQIILLSPFYRCVQTSQPVAQALGVPIVLERGVGEWYKKDRGVIPEPVDYPILQAWFPELLPDLWTRDGLGVIPDLTGETEKDIFDRATKFWLKFFVAFEAKFPEIETVLIMTHAATKIALGLSLLGHGSVDDVLDAQGTRLRAGACSLDKYALLKSESKWSLLMNGNCLFLTKGEEMHWNFQSGFEAGSDEDIKARAAEAAAEAAEKEKWKKEGKLDEETEDIYVTIELPISGEGSFLNFDESLGQQKGFHTRLSNLSKKSESSGSKLSSSTTGTAQITQELGSSRRKNGIKPLLEFQITAVGDEVPLIKLSNNGDITNLLSTVGDGGNIYAGQWNKLVGTDMVFDDYGEVVGVVREHIKCDENFVLKPKERPDDDLEEDTDAPMDEDQPHAHATGTWKKLYGLAKKKEAEKNNNSNDVEMH